MALLRQYKLQKLGIPIDSKYEKIIKFVDSTLSNLQIFEMEKYSGYLFFMSSYKENVLQYNKRTKSMYVKYVDFWRVLENNYEIQNYEIQNFLQRVIEDICKLEITYAIPFSEYRTKNVEEAYKLKNNEPI